MNEEKTVKPSGFAPLNYIGGHNNIIIFREAVRIRMFFIHKG